MNPNTFSLVRELASAAPVAVRIKGRCMAPVLADGATIAVRARFALPGDVIVFRTPAGDLAAHRLLGWRRRGLVTKGDHADSHDAPVRAEHVIGVAHLRIGMRDRLRALASFAQIACRKLLR